MKKIILLLILSTFTHKAFNQNYISFPTSNAIWNEHYNSEAFNCNYYYSIIGDTVISGTTYHNIIKQQFPYAAENFGGFRENSQKQIYFYSYLHSTEFLIYDFSKIAGDTIFFDNAQPYGYLPYIIIENVDSALVQYSDPLGNSGVEYRKRFITNRVYPFYYNPLIQYSEIWIEGIGSNRGLLSVITLEPTCFCSWGLDNFIHNDTTYYFEQHLYNSLTNNTLKQEFQIYPNPSSGLICIKYQKNNDVYKLELVNLTGEIVYSDILNGNYKEIDISFLEKGIYFIKVESQKNTFIDKVVIY